MLIENLSFWILQNFKKMVFGYANAILGIINYLHAHGAN